MGYSIVTNQKINNYFKRSRYYRTNLGLISTVEKNDTRVYNERDKFAFFYNNQYKTTIYGQGNVGDLMFYTDLYIRQDLLAVYLNTEEFIFEFDENMMKEKGPDFYLGHILKELETKHEERIKEAEEKKIETQKPADPESVFKNPGAVNYADLQAYLKKKQAERYSVQELPKKE
jgi:hypothetical protein